MAIDENIKVFIMHVTFLLIIAIYLVKQSQIALLVIEKVQISIKYLDFSDVFLKKKALVLLEATNLN